MTTKVSGTAHQQLVLEAALVLAEAVSQLYQDHFVRTIRDSSRVALTEFSASTMQRVKAHAWTPQQALRFGNELEDGWDETRANDYLALSSSLQSTEGAVVSSWHLNSYPLYPDLCPPNNDGDYPAERLSQIAALYAVTELMVNSSDEDPYHYDDAVDGVSSLYIFNPELRALVLHPGDQYTREAVVNVIKDHDTFDPERIKRILDFEVTSLRGGAL